MDRIRECNGRALGAYRLFTCAGQRLGFVRDDFAACLADWPRVFVITPAEVALSPALAGAGPARRSAALAEVAAALRGGPWLGPHWWDEPFAVKPDGRWGAPEALVLERAALQRFGVCGFGVHLNGYVRRPDGLYMWLGRRARAKPSYPGLLDQIVAGGQPAGLGLLENLVKECAEEAAMAPELARRAVPVGAVSYGMENDFGLRPDVLFVYDLELPQDFVPVNTDGEVDEFLLWPVEQVAEAVESGHEFKFNCALVVIDFLIRHGLISPEHPDYLDLVGGLRQRGRLFDELDRAGR